MKIWGFGKKKREVASEGVSVVLKRQMPILHGEEPRSWIGGLPKMPEAVEWPRDGRGVPLAFAAQVCCADLPEDLWNGLGPRQGWLLIFAEPEEFLEDTENDLVQVIHIDALGPEREVPDDMPFWRFELRGPRGVSDEVATRLGVPKHWRKWPVDVLVQRYSFRHNEWGGFEGPPGFTPEELHGGPGHEYSLCAVGTIPFDRPLTWRGAAMSLAIQAARYAVSEEASRHVLSEAPEPDQGAFNEELQRRLEQRPEMENTEPGYYWGQQKAREEETARLKAERRTGWVERAFMMAEREEKRGLEDQQRNLDELKAARLAGDVDKAAHCESRLSYFDEVAKDKIADRKYVTDLLAPFRNPEGEAAITAEIEAGGETHKQWVKRQLLVVEELLEDALAHDLDATLPAEEWARISSRLGAETIDYFTRGYSARVIGMHTDKTEIDVTRNDVLLEELLDLYASRDPRWHDLPAEVKDDIEAKLRNCELVHRMGGLRDPQQGDTSPDDDPLIFQLASDDAVGWLWADVGCLYATLPDGPLKKGRFDRSFAWLEGG